MKLRKRIRLLTIAVRSKNEQLTRKEAVIVDLREQVAEREDALVIARRDWKATRTAIAETRDLHKPMDVPTALGRPGTTERRCDICTTRLFPCPTYKALNHILERRQA